MSTGYSGEDEGDSGANAKGIPSRRRRISERSDAGTLIISKTLRLRQETTHPERSVGTTPQAEKGVRGKGRQPLSPLSTKRPPGERQLDGCAGFRLRIESPRISIRCALSRMPSAAVASPICSCQRATGNCDVTIVERVW